MADFYEILGVNKNADAKELKLAYRKLAMKYHPDKNPGDDKAEKKFKEINATYDILKDEQKRAAYDRYGEAAFNGSGGGTGQGFGGFDFSGARQGNGASFSDMFEDLFSGGGRHGQQSAQADNRGSDMRYNMEVTLEEAYSGERKTIKIPTQVSCDACHGSGSAKKNEKTTCGDCGGAGRVRIQQGFFAIERACNSCQGSGSIIKNPCKTCRGQGRIRKQKKLMVKIPVGVEEGVRIRLAGEGEAGTRGGDSGDLYIFLSIKPHKIFERDNRDIHCVVPIKMSAAILGGYVEVPTISGSKAKVTIPEGTQTGGQFRLRGKGMSIMNSNSHFGDMYVHVSIETPINLTKKQKELMREFDELSSKVSNPKSEGFLGKVKDFFKEMKDS